MRGYGTVIPWEKLPDHPEYPTDRNTLISEDPPIVITHTYDHDFIPEVSYSEYESEDSVSVFQFFVSLVASLSQRVEYKRETVPLRVVLNHAVNHTELSDDEAYEILTELCSDRQTPLQLTDSGRVEYAGGDSRSEHSD